MIQRAFYLDSAIIDAIRKGVTSAIGDGCTGHVLHEKTNGHVLMWEPSHQTHWYSLTYLGSNRQNNYMLSQFPGSYRTETNDIRIVPFSFRDSRPELRTELSRTEPGSIRGQIVRYQIFHFLYITADETFLYVADTNLKFTVEQQPIQRMGSEELELVKNRKQELEALLKKAEQFEEEHEFETEILVQTARELGVTDL